MPEAIEIIVFLLTCLAILYWAYQSNNSNTTRCNETHSRHATLTPYCPDTVCICVYNPNRTQMAEPRHWQVATPLEALTTFLQFEVADNYVIEFWDPRKAISIQPARTYPGIDTNLWEATRQPLPMHSSVAA
jgi:hypothetical protein